MSELSRLPGPVTERWDWQLRAACRDLSTDLFFHPERERGPARLRRDRQAKAICSGCPVLEACRRHSLLVREPYGVWGGLTEDERGAAPAS
jgi:WhiB family redox-sensing transcriptional regulator